MAASKKDTETASADTTFDMDAARARRLESSGASLNFVFGGVAYSAPSPLEWPLEISELAATGDAVAALKALLGDQWEAFAANKPTIGDIRDLMEFIGKAGAGSLGKLTDLGAVLLGYGSELEADFHEFYGIDLAHCTIRKAYVLMSQLPERARVVAKASDTKGWSLEAHLAAVTVDAINELAWMYLASHRDPNSPAPPRPQRIPRPGVEQPEEAQPELVSGRDLARVLKM